MLSPERQSALMSKLRNDGLTAGLIWSDSTVCFPVGVKGLTSDFLHWISCCWTVCTSCLAGSATCDGTTCCWQLSLDWWLSKAGRTYSISGTSQGSIRTYQQNSWWTGSTRTPHLVSHYLTLPYLTLGQSTLPRSIASLMLMILLVLAQHQ